MQSALLLFESNAFPIAPGEDEQTNPGIFGRALAERLFGTDTRGEAIQRVFTAVRQALESSPDIRTLTEESAEP